MVIPVLLQLAPKPVKLSELDSVCTLVGVAWVSELARSCHAVLPGLFVGVWKTRVLVAAEEGEKCARFFWHCTRFVRRSCSCHAGLL